MFGLIKKMFLGLLTDVVSASNHTKCVSLSNQKCGIELALINLHQNEYIQELHYYPFPFKLDRCVWSCNTINDLSNKVYVPNKTEDLNLFFQHDLRNKWIKKINKAYITRMYM